MNGETSGENREIKVDASQAGQAERNSKKVKLLHAEICGLPLRMSRGNWVAHASRMLVSASRRNGLFIQFPPP
jgi:hypothetical protein